MQQEKSHLQELGEIRGNSEEERDQEKSGGMEAADLSDVGVSVGEQNPRPEPGSPGVTPTLGNKLKAQFQTFFDRPVFKMSQRLGSWPDIEFSFTKEQSQKSYAAASSSRTSESTSAKDSKLGQPSIFSDSDSAWLVDHLNNDPKCGAARNYRHVAIASHPPEYLKAEAEKCSLVILCLSHARSYDGIVEKFLEPCHKQVVIIVTGVENAKTEKEISEYWRNVCKNLKWSKFDVITLTRQYEETIGNDDSETRERLNTKINAMKEILQNPAAKTFARLQQKRKVDIGIFSRSDEVDYSWLIELLKSANFNDRVQNVYPCVISNNGRQQFRDAVYKCKFGILYHTKNRGRINVTDVTDSLYDEELQHLSITLGRDNVIVVIDDLEDSRDEMKRQILHSQKSIGNLAKDLFLFSHNEKLRARTEMKITHLRALITDSKDLSSEPYKDDPFPPSPPGTP